MKNIKKSMYIIVLFMMTVFLCQCKENEDLTINQLPEVLPEEQEEQKEQQDEEKPFTQPEIEVQPEQDLEMELQPEPELEIETQPEPELEMETQPEPELEIEVQPEPEEYVKVDKNAMENMAYLAEQGYYVIIPTSDGGYQVMVHGGEAAYGRQLIQEYLAKIGCCNNGGITGGWISQEKDQYIVSLDGNRITLLDESENDW